jgi:uncharacterized protein (DUF433 family)
MLDTLDTDELIRRYISVPYGSPDPDLRKEPFIRDKGTPVWVIVGYHLGGHSLDQTVEAFSLTEEELQAALSYYKHHESEITHRLELNETPLP